MNRKQASFELVSDITIRVYDNGGDTTDRYTVVLVDLPDDAGSAFTTMLGIDGCGGRHFSQFTSGQEGRHLGKLVRFQDLSLETQSHIARRLGH